MKILLIYPYWLEKRKNIEDVVVPPIGIYYLGAVLKKNRYDVEILNWYNINETPEKIKKILKDKKPDIIGFSVLQANRWGAIEIAGIAKRINPGVKIIFGGISATFLWKHFLTHFHQIDFIVIGEGEYTLLNLVRCLEKGNKAHLNDVKGIAFRKNGKITKTDSADPIHDLDSLPVPSKYFKYQHLSLTRGCPGKCRFCGSPKFWGPKVRFHSVEYFVNEIELLYNKGVTFFYFSDDTFSVDKNRVIQICKALIEKKLLITWFAISRVNYMGEELLYWMRKAGCIQISYGIESGSEKIRTILNKQISTREIQNAFEMTGRYGILPRAYFIYGCPGENWETIGRTIELIRKIKPFVAHFYVLSLYPGTVLYEEYKRNFKVTDDIWLSRIEDIKYFETDKELSSKLVISFGEKLRTDFYKMLPDFADQIGLIDNKEFYPMHADFCSRLGMTFDHGDYALNDKIEGKIEIARKLYEKALGYYPDSRAFLGLGIIYQKKGENKKSIKILSEGTTCFPDNMHLNICISISYMNSGRYKDALLHLLKYQDSKQAIGLIVDCYNALNDVDSALAFQKRLANHH